MKVTTRHPASKHGFPVVLDEDGHVLESRFAVSFFRRYHGLSRTEFGNMCGVGHAKVYHWEYGHCVIPANALNVIRDYLEDEKERVLKGGFKTINGELRAGYNVVTKRLYPDIRNM